MTSTPPRPQPLDRHPRARPVPRAGRPSGQPDPGRSGADVVKVGPGSGDDTRASGPPWLKDADGQPTRESAYFLCTNRNKRSITVDMASPEGQQTLRDLAAKADIVLENFKTGGSNTAWTTPA